MGQFHPHGDSAIYDALVRLVQPWSCATARARPGQLRLAGQRRRRRPRYTETKMAPLALEMVRDIDEETVDFQDNYDGRTQEPSIPPARFPNLLVNGSVGIAVGMATNILPHNLREVARAPSGTSSTLRPRARSCRRRSCSASRARLPDRRADPRRQGHQRRLPHGPRLDHDARGRLGRGAAGRTCLVVTELPYQVNPDNLAIKIADLVKDGKIAASPTSATRRRAARVSVSSSC